MLLLAYAGRTLHVDDEAGETMLRYADEIARAGEWDTVDLAVRTEAGDTVDATIVVGAGAPMPCMTRSPGAAPIDPNNAAAEVQRMRRRVAGDALSTEPSGELHERPAALN